MKMQGGAAMDRILEDLDALVGAGLITQDQAVAINVFETERYEEEREIAASRRVPLITEALGYLGAGLAAAAMGVLLSEQWSQLSTGARLAIPLASAVVLVIAGWLLREAAEPAFARFGAVLWALSVAATAWATAIFASDVMGLSDIQRDLEVGVVTTTLAVALYATRRTALQQLALGAGAMVLVTSIVRLPYADNLGGTSAENTAIGLAIWATAMVWMVLAYRGVLVPETLAYGLGAFVALQGAQAVSFANDTTSHAGMALGLLTGMGMIAASVWLRENVLLAFGAIGTFGFLVSTIDHFFRDTLGTPLVLLATGVILLAVAFLTMRLRRSAGPHPPTARAG
jgi:hypothetical protein